MQDCERQCVDVWRKINNPMLHQSSELLSVICPENMAATVLIRIIENSFVY